MTDISNTDSGKIILGAISAAEAEWRRKIVQFISDQIPRRLSPVQHCALRLRLQPNRLTFGQIGKLIEYTEASANLKFRSAVRILTSSAWSKLYKSDIEYWWDLDLTEEIREAVLSIPMPEIPVAHYRNPEALISIKERQKRHTNPYM